MTVACLLLISARYVKVKTLEIPFNITNIIEDFKNISEDPQFWEMRWFPKRPLMRLDLWRMPPTLDELGFETMVNGLVDILLSLRYCQGRKGVWEVIPDRMRELRET